MQYIDTLISRYDDHEAFQTAFRRYFDELDIQVEQWDELFAEMTATGRTFTWLRQDNPGIVVGFIMFEVIELNSWFFTAKCGFIREFWIAPELRRQGHGSELLRKAGKWSAAQGCRQTILTTRTAAEFYLRHGYVRAPGIAARNEDEVFVKPLK